GAAVGMHQDLLAIELLDVDSLAVLVNVVAFVAQVDGTLPLGNTAIFYPFPLGAVCGRPSVVLVFDLDDPGCLLPIRAGNCSVLELMDITLCVYGFYDVALIIDRE